MPPRCFRAALRGLCFILMVVIAPSCQTTAKEARGRGKKRAGLWTDGAAMVFPTTKRTISSPFGRRWGKNHQGVDIPAPMGTPIYAVENGRSEFAGNRRGYGLTVVIRHKKFKTLYAHCKKIAIKPGMHVHQGQVIAYVGKTGNAEAPHLHFEFHTLRGKPLDPLPFLRASRALHTF